MNRDGVGRSRQSATEHMPEKHHSKRLVEMAERSAREGATEDCLRQLRGLCLGCGYGITIGYDRSLQDPHQLIVLLQARGAA